MNEKVNPSTKLKLTSCNLELSSIEMISLSLIAPLWLYFGSYALAPFTLFSVIRSFKLTQLYNIRKHGIDRTDLMDGISFEIWLERLFKDLGYQVTRTRPSGDLKADLIFESPTGRTVVQAKKKFSGSISKKAVEEVLEAKKNYNATKTIVITNQFFGPSAKEMAEKHEVILWDRDSIITFLKQARNNRFPNNLKNWLSKKLIKQ